MSALATVLPTSDDAWFAPKLKPLWGPGKYKILRGGRGGGKSWAVARWLVVLALRKKIRVLCTRETQKSMRDSVHRLLVDQIAQMGLARYYNIKQIEITAVNGSQFIFAGLSDQTAASIKSYEGVNYCWVEEGQVVSEYSWSILLPTLFRPRKGGDGNPTKCEVVVTFNPELDTDPTWKRFIEKPPPDAVHIELNWRDNPWFPPDLNELRLHDKATLPKYEYEWIWEGKCKPAITGAIYADSLAEMFSQGRVMDVPVDRSLPVYAAFDLGFNDSTAIVLFQRKLSSLRIVDYIEDHHKRPDHYSKLLRERDYEVQQLFLPHDGANDHLTGQSAQRDFEDLNWQVTVLPRQDVEQGIRAVRSAFPGFYVDSRCERLIECLKRYRRTIPATTKEPSHPRHDEYSHGADAVRYMVLAAPMADSADGLKLPPLKWNWDFNGKPKKVA